VIVDRGRPLHLTYCTNIHPGDGWAAVAANLARHAPPLKQRFSPNAPFGIGLRLSDRDARELLGGPLDEFRAFLDREGLYVAIINGFPYGSFHRTAVKAAVYAPDWRDPERVRYTLNLIDILRRLLPEGVDGGVSTAPLSYKAWMTSAGDDAWQTMTSHVVRVAEALVRVRDETGAVIHLDIEPEPDCSIENTDETLAFFENWLLARGAPLLARATGSTVERAGRDLLDHIRVCFDCCHFAVEYEDPATALDRLTRAGIRIGRIQLSSAIRVEIPGSAGGPEPSALARLRTFADPVYLHQVVERPGATAGGKRQFPDLDVALAAGGSAAREWRVHFHVPLFLRDYEELGSTQDYVRQVLELARRTSVTTHLEIETYTWDVLPPALKADLGTSIAREYAWVLGALQTPL
jgi:sugar phosphate isomerase/epimerase